MKILALDSSGLTASAALLADGQLLAEYTTDYKKTHSQTLLPMVDEIVRMTDFNVNELDAVAAAAGPGSFTGLRIGTATAKGLGLALNIPLIAVPTLEAMAYDFFGAEGLIVPMLDARRQQVYTGIYRFEGQKLTVVSGQQACPVAALIDRLNQAGEKCILLGDGADAYRGVLEEQLQIPFCFAPAHLNRQRAAAVGALAMVYYSEGRTVSAADFRPDYLRKPQAEREQEERGRSMQEAESRSRLLDPVNHSETVSEEPERKI